MRTASALVMMIALIATGCSAEGNAVPVAVSSTSTTAAPVTTLAPVPEPPTTVTTTATVPQAPSIALSMSQGDVVTSYAQEFSGATDPGSTVSINGVEVVGSPDGTFALDGWWNTPGMNTVAVAATSPDGPTRTVRVTYEFAPREGWIAFVGDSILRGATPEIEARFGVDVVRALSGRRFDEGIPVIEDVLSHDPPPELLIIGLGSNGPVQREDFSEVMELATDVPRVAFVNVRANRRWEDDSNRELATGVARHPNAILIDWHGASEDVDRLLRDDLVHPTVEGYRILAELIADSVFPQWQRTEDP